VGKQIWNRINFDNNISNDAELRKSIAYEFIDHITNFRNILKSETRDLSLVSNILKKISEKPEYETKILAWILEAYLLLNQSSTASADVSKNKSSEVLFAKKLLGFLVEHGFTNDEILEIFSSKLSANLVLTAHPTAGIQPDYMYHISNIIEKVNSIADAIREENDLSKVDEKIEEIKEDLAVSISHMIRIKPYNENKLKPFDESNNFLKSISQIYEIIPETLVALAAEISKSSAKRFYIHPNFFRLHSWVARDIDGNPTVSKEEHFKALIHENLYFYKRYLADLQKLWQTLSDDFTFDKELPSKTFFIAPEFKQMYEDIVLENPVFKLNKQAYRLVIEHKLLQPLSKAIDSLETQRQRISYTNEYNYAYDFDKYCSEETLLKPLQAILANKEGVNSKEIEILIKKIEVFGKFGSFGHTRQGNDIINFLMEQLSGFQIYGNVSEKTEFLLSGFQSLEISELSNKVANLRHALGEAQEGDALATKYTQKAAQTLDVLSLAKSGGIKRQIISMNTCFEDMLNALILSRYVLGDTEIEIVPLTEQISDLRNSYRCTLEALSNRAWREYLLKQQGRFVKMRGPSDSGKQNGFAASQWEMFRSKQQDTLVVEIFNSFLYEHVFNNLENRGGDFQDLAYWREKAAESFTEHELIKECLEAFGELFSRGFTAEEKKIWQKAYLNAGLTQVTLINFDGWGEPIERGGGLEFRLTATCTQPIGSSPHYERTLQGGGAQQLISFFKSHEMIQDFIFAIAEIGARSVVEKKLPSNNGKDLLLLDPRFVRLLDLLINKVRSQLRSEVFGLDLDNDNVCVNESVLREYFSHVIKSPLVYLDLFNIASRPTSRSGAKVKTILEDAEYNYDLDLLSKKLPISEILGLLADIRAIPYSAMFNLIGGNHVSFYGYQEIEGDDEFIAELRAYYHGDDENAGIEVRQDSLQGTVAERTSSRLRRTNDRSVLGVHEDHEDDENAGIEVRQQSQETRLLRHIVDSLERGVFTADLDAYAQARKIIESVYNPEYSNEDDVLLQKLMHGNQATRNFIAKVKNYKVQDPQRVSLKELLQDNPEERDLLLARRDDAVIPRIGLAYSISKIINHCKENQLNPLSIANIPLKYLDLLRKAFSAGASTFGNGCID